MNALWIMVHLKLNVNNSTLNAENLLTQWPSNLDGHLHYCIGLSGGIDSVVLLHLFKQLSVIKPLQLSAIHVNHGLSNNALFWQNFCTKLCQDWQIPLNIAPVNVSKIGGEGLENSARKLRYAEYAKTKADVIILAHHHDDQIETMLSQIMRGSDLHNVAAMHLMNKRQEQIFWRPLLDYRKTQLQEYALKYHLENINDESNQDNQYLRNFLRNKIIPQLIDYDSQIITKLNQSLLRIQDSVKLNDDLAQIDLNQCLSQDKLSLLRLQFCQLNSLRQCNLLSWYLTQQQFALPSHKKVLEFTRQVNNARPDRHPALKINTQYKLICTSQLIKICQI